MTSLKHIISESLELLKHKHISQLSTNSSDDVHFDLHNKLPPSIQHIGQKIGDQSNTLNVERNEIHSESDLKVFNLLFAATFY